MALVMYCDIMNQRLKLKKISFKFLNAKRLNTKITPQASSKINELNLQPATSCNQQNKLISI